MAKEEMEVEQAASENGTTEVVDSSVVEVGSLVEDEQDESTETVEETVSDEVEGSEEEGDSSEKETSEKEDDEKKSKLKVFPFDKTQEKMFCIDGKTLSVSVFKKIDFTFKTETKLDLEAIAKTIAGQVHRILTVLKCEDVIVFENHKALEYGKVNIGHTVMIPYSERTTLTVTNLTRILDKLNQEYQSQGVNFRMKSKDMVKIHYDETTDTDFFFKGFVGVSHENGFETPDGRKGLARNYLRAAAYISKDAGLTGKDISLFNRYNLTLSKLNFFDESKENERKGKGCDFFMNFKKKFAVISYGVGLEGTTLKAHRSVVTISLKYSSIMKSTRKIATGILLNKESSDFEIKSLQDLFSGDVLTSFTGFEADSYENETFATEIQMLNDNLIAEASEAPEEPAQEQPAKN